MAAQNLNDGSAQALQALLHSLSPGSATEGGKLSSAAVEKLSAKLAELVGTDVGEPQRRNEEGQLLNEEGLPIIEITEPIQGSEPQSSSYLDEDAPVPIADLSSAEKERRRRERDRILDLLEEEEQTDQAREEESSQEQRQEILRKKKQAAQDEVARLKAAKNMQRKMGKALLRDMSTSRDQATPQPPAPKQEVVVQDAAPASRKTVTFADASAPEVETSESREGASDSDWGDVVPARLRANSGRALMSSARFDTAPMKMQVVERMPGKPVEPQPDSDDESEPPDSPTISDEDEEGGFESDEELAEELDLDFARHQREIALEYHAKRVRMAETTSSAMQSHFQNDLSHTTTDEFVNQSSRKPAISHFQANRLTSSYNAAAPSSSKSLGDNVLPASSARTLQRAIRLGKLDSDNRLVGGESGSDEEDDGAMQEIMELLKKGEVYNVGPDGNFLHTVPPAPKPSANGVATPPATPGGPPPTSRKPQASKFKLARSGQRFSAPSPDTSDPSTPPSTAARSSPKLPEPMAESLLTTPSSTRPNVLSSTVFEKSPPSANTSFSSMIIDSPSFPETRRPQQPPTVVRAADKPVKVSRFLAERM
ncbi:hypothetical protein B0H19DRAFT_1198549 [Mycena capillaripes]|nr:hypothetical protein B0H19DRAFT_1198549 [Mycena capillaripes]